MQIENNCHDTDGTEGNNISLIVVKGESDEVIAQVILATYS